MQLTNEIQLLMDNWILYLKNIKGYSQNTIIAYHSDLKHFFKFILTIYEENISLTLLNQLIISDFRAWFSYRISNDLTSKSNVRAYAAIKSYFKYLAENKLIKLDVISNVKRPKIEKKLPRPIRYEKILEFLQADYFYQSDPKWITLRDKLLYCLLYTAGLRIQEALDLSIDDIYDVEFMKVKGKGDKERVVPILNVIKSMLLEYLKECPYINYNGEDRTEDILENSNNLQKLDKLQNLKILKSNALNKNKILFYGLKGKKLLASTIDTRIAKIRILYDLADTATPHAFRHSFASHLINDGADLRSVQELMGHTSLSSTQVYTQIDDGKLLSVYQNTHPLEMDEDE